MGYTLPAALCVYWIANAAFSVVQEMVLNKHYNEILDREETDKEREKREKRYARYEKQRAMMEQYNTAREQSGKKKPQQSKPQQQKKREQGSGTNENGRIGQRPYARGRAFSEDHYGE